MHNILFDLSCLQAGPNAGGAAAYAKTILESLISSCKSDVRVFGLYNSQKPFHKLYQVEEFVNQNGIKLLDASTITLAKLITKYSINTFFIPVGQYVMSYDLSNILCRTIVVIHDIFDIEGDNIGIDTMLQDSNLYSKQIYIKKIINYYSKRRKHFLQKRYAEFINFCKQSNVNLFTVSEYSKFSLQYHIHSLRQKKIGVLYSPAKRIIKKAHIENEILASLIKENKKFFLLISANRIYKNAYNVLQAFMLFSELNSDYYLITVNYPKSLHKKHIVLPTLSESDLEYAYQHAEALIFASFFEGFGYPPIEAMKYGTPVLASNVTSIPEITNIGGLYFSPFYPADIFRALVQFTKQDNMILGRNALMQYKTISTKQMNDLEKFVKLIISNSNNDIEKNNL